MRKMIIFAGFMALMVLVACGPSVQPTPSPSPPPSLPAVTSTPPALEDATDAYPAQEPSPMTLEGEYPAPAATQEPTPYPADMTFWMLRPLGQQCADPESYVFADLDAAAQSLEDAGVEVLATEETTRPVCAACDCVTSEHFRVQIQAQDLATVEEMGWFRE